MAGLAFVGPGRIIAQAAEGLIGATVDVSPLRGDERFSRESAPTARLLTGVRATPRMRRLKGGAGRPWGALGWR